MPAMSVVLTTCVLVVARVVPCAGTCDTHSQANAKDDVLATSISHPRIPISYHAAAVSRLAPVPVFSNGLNARGTCKLQAAW